MKLGHVLRLIFIVFFSVLAWSLSCAIGLQAQEIKLLVNYERHSQKWFLQKSNLTLENNFQEAFRNYFFYFHV